MVVLLLPLLLFVVVVVVVVVMLYCCWHVPWAWVPIPVPSAECIATAARGQCDEHGDIVCRRRSSVSSGKTSVPRTK